MFQIVSINPRLDAYDEGLIAYGAARVLRGDIPYRDFWTAYGPGQFYVVAALFKLFGKFIAVERAWDVIVKAGISLLSYALINKLATRPFALAGWATSAI